MPSEVLQPEITSEAEVEHTLIELDKESVFDLLRADVQMGNYFITEENADDDQEIYYILSTDTVREVLDKYVDLLSSGKKGPSLIASDNNRATMIKHLQS